ncbi:Peptide methionine sulfoxide reductase MsrA [Seminavis robusta]|uniref:peptide-methionine (S)-S-oxide reductase n=1 Tax=Seminavis robusta TaxID=568900 RepID=A0A9N8DIR0_9STRA|nr:Peptide methionine sulfoxide reductase MsrA [Seminavis robusta]|eukprot:Sro180_g078650.1 Peptide methionine sulfoxide reductase MsrA (585) ;mRNA; r:13106-14860
MWKYPCFSSAFLFVALLLASHPEGIRCFATPRISNKHGVFPFQSTLFSSPEGSATPPPRAVVEGYISPSDQNNVVAALQRVGFDTSLMNKNNNNNHDNPQPEECYRYAVVKATGMLKLLGHPPIISNDDSNNNNIPKWIPLISDMEHVLIQNGWSFLDPDESEPLSAYNVDAANAEGLYQPKWGQQQQQQQYDNSASFSDLGYSLTPWTKDQIMEQAALFLEDDALLTRQVLLHGATDPPQRKTTHNGYNFAGSMSDNDKHGIFVCAVGGLPLFTTHHLMASAGWLSFAAPISEDHVELVPPLPESTDRRVEVVCARTKCHLGHYFGTERDSSDGYYCINASALDFYSLESMPTVSALIPSSFRFMEQQLSSASSSPALQLLQQMIDHAMPPTKTVLLGAGCFWHVESALRRLPGVVSTSVGFAGGTVNNVSYEQVCHEQTGHAEVVRVEFVPDILPVRVLLDCFLAMHDPTKSRALGKHAKGTGQYRSCLFVFNNNNDPEIMTVAEQALEECQRQLGKEVATELRQVDAFWEAEERHQRHNEKRSGKKERLSTLTATEWLSEYGKRSPSVLGSAESLVQQLPR